VKETKLAKIAEARRQQKIIRQGDKKEFKRRVQRRDSFIRQHSMQDSSKLGKFFGEEPKAKRESFSHRMSNKLHEFEHKIEHEAHVLKQKLVALEHELEHEAHVIAHELSDLAHHGAVHVEVAKGSSKEDQACRKIQLWWFKMNGSYATRMKQRAKLQLLKEMEEMEKSLSHLDRCRLNTTHPCWYSYKGCCNRNFLKFFVGKSLFVCDWLWYWWWQSIYIGVFSLPPSSGSTTTIVLQQGKSLKISFNCWVCIRFQWSLTSIEFWS
jgi:hypothetical protein